jgi:hypothetical protein
MLSTNRFIGVNYLDDNSKMAVPPEYWLQRLYDYDAELVVFPSRYRPYAYVLARRQRFSRGSRDVALESTITQPDTKLCLERHLVPVTMIYRTGVTWSIDNIIAKLKARDIWAHGGAEKVAETEDAADEAEATRKREATRQDMWARSGQAWESYQRRTGQRVTSPGLGSERQLPPTGSSRSTAGSGLVITG